MPTLARQIRNLVWARRGLAGWAGWLALQPASGVFAAGVALRDLGYRTGLLRTQRAAVPVISVGNLCVGGTGKTPISLWLARQLAAHGARVAILLRGYRGRARGVTVVSRGCGPEADVDAVGDEAIMLGKCFDGVVLTARRRAAGAAVAAQLGCQVVVLDDGFQHRALARDFDLVLINGRGGALLPAGPMRERPAALRRAHAVALVAKTQDGAAPRAATPPAGSIPAFVVRFTSSALVESDGGRWKELPIAMLSGARVAVVCGVADPGPFYVAVRQWEAQVEEIFEFADHHRYTAADWQRICRGSRDSELIVTTEKDLVKLERFPFARGKLVALRMEPQFDDGAALVRLVSARVGLAQVGAASGRT